MAAVGGNKRGMLHYCRIRNGLEETVAVPCFLEMACEVALQGFPQGLGRDPANLVASDDGESPGRCARIHQNRPRSLCVGEFPILE